MKNGIDFEHQKKVDKYFPDFTIGNLIIEIDGKRWHDPLKDANRDTILSNCGYSVIRISTNENIEERIKDILNLG